MEHQQPNRILSTLQQFSETQSVPTDIAVEILLRLPVESVLRCKSVCKSWRSLISDPQFVKSHLAISTRSNNNYRQHRLIFRRTQIESCNLHDVLYDNNNNNNNSINNALELDYPSRHLLQTPKIVGSCNGLVCIAVYGFALFIWNPSTRKSHILPPSDYNKEPDLFALHGFGYQQSTGDYKVVEISPKLNNRETLVRIYSLKNGNWKEMGVYPRVFSFFDFGKFSNGALHWIAGKDLGTHPIVALDLEKETYGEVLQPDYDEIYRHFKLGSLREQLCVLCDYPGVRADLWVMKVYGVKDSWTKLVSIPYLTDPGRDRFLMPLCVSTDGKILLQFGQLGVSKLVVYDSKNGSFSENQNVNICHHASTFVESLVSPMPTVQAAAGLGDG